MLESKYKIGKYEPESIAWVKRLYKKWIELFAGEYLV